MPRKGDNITRTDAGKYKVKFKVKSTVRLADGTEETTWSDKSRTFETLDAAKAFKREVENTAAAGKAWKDERLDAVVTLGTIAAAYNEAASAAPETTQTWRRGLMKAWTDFAGEDTPATALNLTLLERYAASLPTDGRKGVRRHRKILEVETMWTWAHKRPDRFPGVGVPMAITGKDANSVKPPPPVIRTATPTMDDVDAMIAEINKDGWKYGATHWKVALILRYTGLRIGQAIRLTWEDVLLDYADGPYLIVRMGIRGSKASTGRVVPIHPGLAAEMAGWGRREGVIFPYDSVAWSSGEPVRDAFIDAWTRAKVAPEKWSVTAAQKARGERGAGSPCHAFRSAIKVRMLREGVSDTLVDYFVGHSTSATKAAYVPESHPETSPYWPHLRAAIAAIPDHREARGKVTRIA